MLQLCRTQKVLLLLLYFIHNWKWKMGQNLYGGFLQNQLQMTYTCFIQPLQASLVFKYLPVGTLSELMALNIIFQVGSMVLSIQLWNILLQQSLVFTGLSACIILSSPLEKPSSNPIPLHCVKYTGVTHLQRSFSSTRSFPIKT